MSRTSSTSRFRPIAFVLMIFLSGYAIGNIAAKIAVAAGL